jgi:hypothetical protein
LRTVLIDRITKTVGDDSQANIINTKEKTNPNEVAKQGKM